jgi:hypothetical protein
MAQPDTIEIAERAFATIHERFPNLTMTRHPEDPVEISIRLPIQPGLKHFVWLGLQNGDELHFQVEHFWLEWFPCTDPQKVAAYVDAVCGFLAGTYRVLEHLREGDCIKAQLQAPEAGSWRTIGTWNKLRLPSFGSKRLDVVSNA